MKLSRHIRSIRTAPRAGLISIARAGIKASKGEESGKEGGLGQLQHQAAAHQGGVLLLIRTPFALQSTQDVFVN